MGKLSSTKNSCASRFFSQMSRVTTLCGNDGSTAPFAIDASISFETTSLISCSVGKTSGFSGYASARPSQRSKAFSGFGRSAP